MNQQLVKTLMVEIDGNMEKLRRALKQGETELKGFEQQSTKTGSTSGAASDAMANKQANAARAIAMTTETIARQGAVSGETAKQLVSQASNVAFAFGPTGAVVGAIGISTLAIVAMFTRARREMQETADKALEMQNRFSEMDPTGQARTINFLATGRKSEDAVLSTSQIMERPEEARTELLRQRGINRLQQDLARLRAEVPELEDWQKLSVGVAGDFGVSSATAREIEAVTAALALLTDEYTRNSEELAENAAAEATRTQEGLKRAAATRATTEALREQERVEKEGERNRETARRQALEAMSADETRRLQQFYTALTQGFKGTRADIEQSFAELVQFAEEKGGQAEIPVLRVARDQALQLADLLERNRELLVGLESTDLGARVQVTGQRTRGGSDEANLAAIERQRNAWRAIANDAARSDEDRETALKEAVSLQGMLEARIKATAKERQQDSKELRQQALMIGQAVDGVLQMAGAWGGVRKEVIETLRAVVQISSNVPGMVSSLESLRRARASSGGSFTDVSGALVTTGAAAAGVAAAALPILGALATIGAQLFGESPAEQERKRVQRENTRAIERLTRQMSVNINVSGTDFAAAVRQVSGVLDFAPEGDTRYAARSWPSRERVLSYQLTGGGADMDFLRRVAQELDVTLDGTAGSFRALEQALEAARDKLYEFSDSYEDQVVLTDLEIQAKQITDPIERTMAKLGPALANSPLLRGLVGNADLSTEAGRAALRESILGILATMDAGGDTLDAEQAGLTRDQFLEVISFLLGSLDDLDSRLPNSAGSSVGGISGFRGLTEAAGERMADYLRGLYSSATTAEGQRARMIDHLAALTALASTPLPVPPLPSAMAARAATTVGSATLVIESIRVELGGINLNIDREDGTDGEAIARAALDSISVQIEQVIYDAVRRGQKALGDLSVAPRAR